MKSLGEFKYKCTCWWSKDNEHGFIPSTECPVHGKATKERLKKAVNYDKVQNNQKEVKNNGTKYKKI